MNIAPTEQPRRTKAITDTNTFDASEKDGVKMVKVVFSKMGVKDFDNDIILQGAYTKTIQENGPQGKKLIYHLKDHQWYTTSKVGSLKELYVQGDLLIGVTHFEELNPLQMANYLDYKSGDINQYSVGYVTIKSQDRDGYKELQELRLLEGSQVLWGANEFTPTLMVKSEYKENPGLLYHAIIKDYEYMESCLKKNIPEEEFYFLTMNFKEKKSQLELLLQPNTEPIIPVTQPLLVKNEIDKWLFKKS